mmetsp:Transcript_17559/g.32568  ORF Transcript_17559/g.32568 Transcript_17559/m.32568 type:complete len:647 (-) Transcript_17559:133-2073(-)
MSFPGFVVTSSTGPGTASASTTTTSVMAVSAAGAPTKQVATSAANARVNSKTHSPSPLPSSQTSLATPPVTRAAPPQISTPTASSSFASQLVTPSAARAQVRSLSPPHAQSQSSSQQGGPLSPRMSARAAAAVAAQNAVDEVSHTMPALPLQHSLEPVQEEQDGIQASTWTPSVQDLKEQLLAERAWWSSTSAAQVTSELAREREERSADIVQLRNDLKTQQVTLAQVARYLLGEKVSFPELETAGPQVAELEATLQELRSVVKEQQENQELQANALREGLMSIHAQQASSHSAVPSAEVESLSASVDSLHSFVNERIEALSKEIALERQARQVREAREAREGVGSFAASGGGQSDIQRQEFERMRAELTQELDKHRLDISEAGTLRRDGVGAKALELHKMLAEELADVIRRSEQQRADMAQALDAERAARISEATDLRTALETSLAVDGTCASARGPPDTAEAQLNWGLAEERALRIREVAESKAFAESMVKRVSDRADSLEQKLAAAKHEWEQHAAIDSHSASQVAAQTVAREYGTEVQNLIRESQEMMRYEFSTRLSELELKMRHHLDFGGTPAPPQSDAEELSSRLEAIKAQLNAEIKKRLERTPGAILAVGTGDQSTTLTVKATGQEQLQRSALEHAQAAC